jgi:hypothetical protein
MKVLIDTLRRLKILTDFNFNIHLDLNSRLFHISFTNQLRTISLYNPELWMMELIKIFHKLKGGTFIAIGVKTGQSLLALKAVNRNINYLAFEHNQRYVHYIEEVIKCNDFANTKVFPYGISDITDRAGTLELHFFMERQGDCFTLFDDDIGFGNEGFYNEANRLINFSIMENIIPEEVCIIKINIEEQDISGFQRIQKLVMQKRPFLLLKFLHSNLEISDNWLQRQDLMKKFIIENNYKAFRIIKDSNKNLKHLEWLESIGNYTDTADADHTLVPAELEAKLIDVSAELGYVQKTDMWVSNVVNPASV